MRTNITFIQHMLLMVVGLVCAVQICAYDFKAQNEDGVTIYYRMNYSNGIAIVVSGEEGDENYKGEVKIPSTVTYSDKTYTITSIGDYAFQKCEGLISVVIPETVTSIGRSAFEGCKSLTTINIPEIVTSIGISAFQGCMSLQTLSLSSNFKTINGSTFKNCFNLKSIELPNTVMEIGYEAFRDCRSLETITLPASLQSIVQSAFQGCSGLKTVFSYIEKPFAFDSWTFSNYSSAVLYVPKGTKEAYQSTEGWKLFDNIVEMGEVTEGTPYAIWCERNTTLYFLTSEETLSVGDSFEGQIITQIWNGTEITETGETEPKWRPVVAESLTKVVFDESFKGVLPTSTYQWFYSCKKLETINGIENLSTSEVTTMRAMFSTCENLKSLDVTGFKTDNVKVMRYLFANCFCLKELDVTHFNTENVTDMAGLFRGCSGLLEINVDNFRTDKVEDMSMLFLDCSQLKKIDVKGFNTANVINMSFMFRGCSSLTELDLKNFDTGLVTNLGSMFYGCSNLINVDLSSFDTQNVAEMPWMFYGCKSLTTIDVSHFNTENVINMRTAFGECHNLKSLDLNSWNVENVENLRSMFVNCVRLSNLKINKWNTRNVKNMFFMFGHCQSLTSLNITNFETGKVEVMDSMFTNCKYMKSIVVGSGWTTNSVQSSKDMFVDCVRIVGENGTTYDSNHTDASYAHIDEENNPGYFSSRDISNKPILTLVCSEGGWMEFDGEHLTNITKSFAIDRGSNVVVEYGADNGYELDDAPEFIVSGNVTIGYSSHQCTVDNMTNDVTIVLKFKRIFTPVQQETINFADAKMKTFCSVNVLDFSEIEGLTAYIASGFSAETGEVILSKVEKVPARTGLLLIGEPNKSYAVPFTETDYVYSNLFEGVTETTTITNGYVLNDGLFEAVAGSQTVNGGEAYLNIPVIDGKKQLKVKFTDTLNGVEDVKLATGSKVPWFTLSGSRLNHKPTHRGTYLRGGKKVLVK